MTVRALVKMRFYRSVRFIVFTSAAIVRLHAANKNFSHGMPYRYAKRAKNIKSLPPRRLIFALRVPTQMARLMK